MNSQATPERGALRREIRAQRRALSERERSLRSHALCVNLARCGLLLRAQRIACFWPNDAEVDLSALFPRLWQSGKRVYLPVIDGPRLWFAPMHPWTRLADNRFGIPEPMVRRREQCPLLALDIVLMPLVAFDGRGNRLGMGGGYYDRTFAWRAQRTHLRRPLLIGAAFAFQRRDHVDARAWDVALDAAITDAGLEWLR